MTSAGTWTSSASASNTTGKIEMAFCVVFLRVVWFWTGSRFDGFKVDGFKNGGFKNGSFKNDVFQNDGLV